MTVYAIPAIYAAVVALLVLWACMRHWAWGARIALVAAVVIGPPLVGVALLLGLDWHGSGWGVAMLVVAITAAAIVGLAVGSFAYALTMWDRRIVPDDGSPPVP
jgi:hypothetical protein